MKKIPIPPSNTLRYGTNGLRNNLINAYNDLPADIRQQCPMP
ncbi:hypothetical protein SNEBB_003244, partial [Seison nebaliae]